ncbi:MAG: hypothetical protein WC326_14415 [Candidatus Delongbacteria bacterium]
MTLMRGYITRLIDVTLIILIGFLSVADLDDRAVLPLPAGLAAVLDTLARDEAQRRLEITATEAGSFLLELSSTTGLNLPLGRVSGADTLRAVLTRLKSEHQLAGADVRSWPRVPLQTAVDAVDACDLCEIPRDVRFLPETGAPAAGAEARP